MGIRWLNELEYFNGEVYANIWQQDRIAIIQRKSGQVTGWIDLSQLRPRMVPPPRDVDGLGAYGKAVANGMAYDAAGGRLFVVWRDAGAGGSDTATTRRLGFVNAASRASSWPNLFCNLVISSGARKRDASLDILHIGRGL
jgi:hypothetical protein